MTLNALEVVARAVARPVIRAAAPERSLALSDWVGMLSSDAVPYLHTTLKLDQEDIDGSFLSLVQGAYRSNGVVFATLATRLLLFSEARFAYRQMRAGRPGNLFGTPALSILEHPEPGRTTGDMLARMMLDNDLAGIWFGLLGSGTIKRLRPDWTGAVFGSKRKDATPQDPDSKLVGFRYNQGGPGSQEPTVSFLPEQVAHFSTIPDGIRNYVGMPWLTPVLRELMSDSAATIHKLAYFRNAAPQPLDARVLTPAGWTTMGSIAVGDRVIGRDGKPHPVLGVYPQGHKNIYRVTFSDGASTECTLDHLWQVSSNSDRRRGLSRSMTLSQIKRGGTHYRSGPAKWAVPLPDPIEFDDPGPLPMDPYLLGVMLGDGSFRNGAVTFSSADAEIVESVRALVPAGVEVVHQKEYSYHVRAGARGTRSNSMVNLATGLGLWNVIGYEKAIPEPYLRASVFDREALLQGLIDTDGYVAGLSGSALRFDNTSETLARQVAELARSLGGRATVTRTKDRPDSPNRRPQWSVWISRLPDWVMPVRLARKRARYHAPTTTAPRVRFITSIESAGRRPAQCIYVDSAEHLYVTDDYVVTHNTPNLTVTMPANLPKDKAEEWIELFEQEHRGAFNSFRTIYFGGGASATKIGADLGELDYRKIQAGGEARIISAGGLHPSLFGLGDIAGGGLNSGNLPAIVRWIADSTMRPSWRNAAGSIEHLVGTPNPGVILGFDDRDVPFLREDVRDAARATQLHGSTIGALINNGFKPDATVDAVTSNDLTRLAGNHTGYVSVQLQLLGAPPDGSAPPPGSAPAGAAPAPPAAERVWVRIGEPGQHAQAIDAVRAAIGAPAAVRARGPFWPLQGPFASIGEVPAGVELPGDNALVREFPFMFEPVTRALLGPGGVRCTNPACNKVVAVRLSPGSIVVCRSCKTRVAA